MGLTLLSESILKCLYPLLETGHIKLAVFDLGLRLNDPLIGLHALIFELLCDFLRKKIKNLVMRVPQFSRSPYGGAHDPYLTC